MLTVNNQDINDQLFTQLNLNLDVHQLNPRDEAISKIVHGAKCGAINLSKK